MIFFWSYIYSLESGTLSHTGIKWGKWFFFVNLEIRLK